MKEIVLRAGPGTGVQFPGLCVRCAGKAMTTMRIHKPLGRLARLVEVPLCAACAQELGRLSAAEEQQQKMRWLLLALLLPISFVLVLFMTPAAYPFFLRLLFGTLAALGLGLVTWFLFQRRLARAALPEKQAIRAAAQIRHFSAQRITFAFTNAQFFARFQELNRERVVDAP